MNLSDWLGVVNGEEMANVKKGNLTAPGERWRHLDFWKRVFWKQERQAQDRAIADDAVDAWRRRGIDRRPTTDEAGDTV